MIDDESEAHVAAAQNVALYVVETYFRCCGGNMTLSVSTQKWLLLNQSDIFKTCKINKML